LISRHGMIRFASMILVPGFKFQVQSFQSGAVQLNDLGRINILF